MMKRIAKKFLLRAFATLLFCLALLAGSMLNPALLYAHKTVYGNCTIYHDKPLPAHLEDLIDASFPNGLALS